MYHEFRLSVLLARTRASDEHLTRSGCCLVLGAIGIAHDANQALVRSRASRHDVRVDDLSAANVLLRRIDVAEPGHQRGLLDVQLLRTLHARLGVDRRSQLFELAEAELAAGVGPSSPTN